MSSTEPRLESGKNLGGYLLAIGMVTIAFSSVFRFTFSAAIGRFLLAAVGTVTIISLAIVLVLYRL